jgi:DNA-directed RNA polymerase subunit RPC12/RpoP
MRTLSFQVRTSCSECGNPLPLNAMVQRVSCAACSAVNDLGADFWQEILGDDDVGTCTILMAGRQVALDVGGAGPACANCGEAIDGDAALAAADAGSIACGKCGTRALLRVPPEAFVVSGMRLLVGEDERQVPAAGTVAVTPEGMEPVAFICPQCGGVLQVDGAARVVKCGYCSASVYLPDDLWHVFHPVPRARRWYILRGGGGRKRDRKEARDPATSPERLTALSRHLDSGVREAVARNPNTPADALRGMIEADSSLTSEVAENPSLPPELVPVVARAGGWSTLGRLARTRRAPQVLETVLREAERRIAAGEGDAADESLDFSDAADALASLARNPDATGEMLASIVRLGEGHSADDRQAYETAAARHAAAPPAVLERLARSLSHEEVRLAVARNPATPAATLESLAADADDDVREAVAKRTEVGPETLLRLGKDEEDAVRAAARANPRYPRWAWLKKLFGG